jgi:hypothetical protein
MKTASLVGAYKEVVSMSNMKSSMSIVAAMAKKDAKDGHADNWGEGLFVVNAFSLAAALGNESGFEYRYEDEHI